MRDLTQAELDQRRFSEAWEMRGIECAERLRKMAAPPSAVPSPEGVESNGLAAGRPDSDRHFDPLAVGLRLLSAAAIVSRCSCGKRYTLAEFEQLEPRGYAGRLGALSYYELRRCGGCGDPVARLVTRGSSGEAEEHPWDGAGKDITGCDV